MAAMRPRNSAMSSRDTQTGDVKGLCKIDGAFTIRRDGNSSRRCIELACSHAVQLCLDVRNFNEAKFEMSLLCDLSPEFYA